MVLLARKCWFAKCWHVDSCCPWRPAVQVLACWIYSSLLTLNTVYNNSLRIYTSEMAIGLISGAAFTTWNSVAEVMFAWLFVFLNWLSLSCPPSPFWICAEPLVKQGGEGEGGKCEGTQTYVFPFYELRVFQQRRSVVAGHLDQLSVQDNDGV